MPQIFGVCGLWITRLHTTLQLINKIGSNGRLFPHPIDTYIHTYTHTCVYIYIYSCKNSWAEKKKKGKNHLKWCPFGIGTIASFPSRVSLVWDVSRFLPHMNKYKPIITILMPVKLHNRLYYYKDLITILFKRNLFIFTFRL